LKVPDEPYSPWHRPCTKLFLLDAGRVENHHDDARICSVRSRRNLTRGAEPGGRRRGGRPVVRWSIHHPRATSPAKRTILQPGDRPARPAATHRIDLPHDESLSIESGSAERDEKKGDSRTFFRLTRSVARRIVVAIDSSRGMVPRQRKPLCRVTAGGQPRQSTHVPGPGLSHRSTCSGAKSSCCTASGLCAAERTQRCEVAEAAAMGQRCSCS
jgi:hypothetical protein